MIYDTTGIGWVLAPAVAFLWTSTLISVVSRPQRYLNSILLMSSLGVTMVFFAGFFGSYGGYYLLGCFLLTMLALFLVPVMLIVNGVHMIKRESFSPAHVLSLALGIVIGVGEIATVVYVLGLSDYIQLERANYWVLLIAATVFYFSFLLLCFVVYSVFICIMPHRRTFDYVIIHGCGLADGSRLTRILSDRVDKAIKVYNKCKTKPIIIPSGGKGDDEQLSEAQAMTDYLVSHGVPEEHIIQENRSTTTRENLINSKEIIDAMDGRKRTALVSSNYHIYRCLRLAREVELDCTGIGSRVAMYYWPSALIREFAAVFLTKRFLIWCLPGYLVFISPILYGLLR